MLVLAALLFLTAASVEFAAALLGATWTLLPGALGLVVGAILAVTRLRLRRPAVAPVSTRPEALGRRGVCPFCRYIGPPLMCGCVTEMWHMLQEVEPLAKGDEALLTRLAVVIGKHATRVQILNEQLRSERV